MIVFAGVLVIGILATLTYIATQLFSYYLVDGIGKCVEAVEQPLEGVED